MRDVWALDVALAAREIFSFELDITPQELGKDTGMLKVVNYRTGKVTLYPIRLKANCTICMVQVQIGQDTTWVQVNAAPDKFVSFLAGDLAKKVLEDYA